MSSEEIESEKLKNKFGTLFFEVEKIKSQTKPNLRKIDRLYGKLLYLSWKTGDLGSLDGKIRTGEEWRIKLTKDAYGFFDEKGDRKRAGKYTDPYLVEGYPYSGGRCGLNPDPDCFVATAVYHNPNASQIKVLRKVRDNNLRKSLIGGLFIDCYYSGLGGKIANFIKSYPLITNFTKQVLDRIVKKYDNMGKL